MAISLTLVGTGTPAPVKFRAGASTLVTLDNEAILFDCGPRSVGRLVESETSVTRITNLFLTHLHYDHCVDYAHLVLTRWDQGSGKIPDLGVYGPTGTERMTELLFAESGVFGPDLDARTHHPGSEFIYEARGGLLPRQRPKPVVTELADGNVIERDHWRVTTAEAMHCQPQLTSLAYRIDAQGKSIVFTGDTAPFPRLTELARNADVLLHMCHMINGVITDERITSCCSGHRDAACTARDAGVRTLVLVHMTDQFDRAGVRERTIREVGEIYSGNVIFGQDLLDVPIGEIEAGPIR